MADEPGSFTEALVRAGHVVVVFGGVAVVAVVAFAPALAPVYLAFEYGQAAGYARYRELIALGGILVGAVVAFLVSRPVFAYGAKYIGNRAR